MYNGRARELRARSVRNNFGQPAPVVPDSPSDPSSGTIEFVDETVNKNDGDVEMSPASRPVKYRGDRGRKDAKKTAKASPNQMVKQEDIDMQAHLEKLAFEDQREDDLQFGKWQSYFDSHQKEFDSKPFKPNPSTRTDNQITLQVIRGQIPKQEHQRPVTMRGDRLFTR